MANRLRRRESLSENRQSLPLSFFFAAFANDCRNRRRQVNREIEFCTLRCRHSLSPIDRSILRAGDDRSILRAGDDRSILRAGDDRSILRAGDDRSILRAGDEHHGATIHDRRIGSHLF